MLDTGHTETIEIAKSRIAELGILRYGRYNARSGRGAKSETRTKTHEAIRPEQMKKGRIDKRSGPLKKWTYWNGTQLYTQRGPGAAEVIGSLVQPRRVCRWSAQ